MASSGVETSGDLTGSARKLSVTKPTATCWLMGFGANSASPGLFCRFGRPALSRSYVRHFKICRAQPFPNDRKLLALNCVLSVDRSSPLRSGWRSRGSALRGRSPHSLNCGVHRPNTLGGGMTIVQSQDAKLRRTAIMPRAQVRVRLGVMVGKDMPTSSFKDTKVQTGRPPVRWPGRGAPSLGAVEIFALT